MVISSFSKKKQNNLIDGYASSFGVVVSKESKDKHTADANAMYIDYVCPVQVHAYGTGDMSH